MVTFRYNDAIGVLERKVRLNLEDMDRFARTGQPARLFSIDERERLLRETIADQLKIDELRRADHVAAFDAWLKIRNSFAVGLILCLAIIAAQGLFR